MCGGTAGLCSSPGLCYFPFISQGFLLKFNTQLLSWPASASVALARLGPWGSSALPALCQAPVQAGFLPPPHRSSVLPGAGGCSCCPTAGKPAPLHGGVPSSIAAGVWGLPDVLGSLPQMVNQRGTEQPSPAAGEGRVGSPELSLARFGLCPLSLAGGCWAPGRVACGEPWALGLAESPSLPSPCSPPLPGAGPCFSGLLGDNLFAPRLLSST